jgi:gamma-glutamylputrescine oxidase
VFDPARSGVYWLETAARPADASPGRPAAPAEARPGALSPPQPAPGDIPARAQVAVIGGGATGVSAAYHLALSGVEAILLEQRAIGSGATCRNGGLFVTGWLYPFARMARRLGPQGARDLWEFTRQGWRLVHDLMARHRIDCEWREEGALFLAEGAEEVAEAEESAAGLARVGLPGEFLSPPALEKRTGVPPAPGVSGAIFVPEAASFHPARLLYPLAAAAREAGAQLIEGVSVNGIEVPRFGEARVLTSHGVLEAAVVIVATNAWTARLLPDLSEQITGQREHVVASRPVAARFGGVGWAADEVHYYWQQRPGGEMVIGGSHWDPWKDGRPQTDETVVPEVAEDLAAYLPQRYAGAPRLDLTHRWIGTMGITCDGLPLIGRLPGRPQILLAAGYNGHGNPLTYLCGRILAEAAVSGRTTIYIPSFFNPGRFLQ